MRWSFSLKDAQWGVHALRLPEAWAWATPTSRLEAGAPSAIVGIFRVARGFRATVINCVSRQLTLTQNLRIDYSIFGTAY